MTASVDPNTNTIKEYKVGDRIWSRALKFTKFLFHNFYVAIDYRHFLYHLYNLSLIHISEPTRRS